VRSRERWLIFGYVLSSLALAGPLARAQGVDVSAQVQLQAKSPADSGRQKGSSNAADVVVWLTPLQSDLAHPMAVGRTGPATSASSTATWTSRRIPSCRRSVSVSNARRSCSSNVIQKFRRRLAKAGSRTEAPEGWPANRSARRLEAGGFAPPSEGVKPKACYVA